MNRLYEEIKFDIGVVSQALNNTNVTGVYYDMSGTNKAIGILNIGAMAATKTGTIEFLQAKDAAGTDAKGIPSDLGQTATATITANTLVTEATIALAAVANTDVVVINGISFTKAAATDETAREFADAAGLVTCVTDATYGVEGLTGSVNGTTVTVKATDPGETLITLDKTENAGTITLATTKAQAYVELQNFSLDHANGFTHIAMKISTTANSVVSGLLLRGWMRDSISQKVGASAVI